MGEKLFAVPWDALKLDTADKRFVLDVDKHRLGTAPRFDKIYWPDRADATWGKGIHGSYGTNPYPVDRRVELSRQAGSSLAFRHCATAQ